VEASFLYKDGYTGGADMTLGIQVNEIKHVLLADRWHEVESQSFALDAYEFMDGDQAVARGDGQLITSVGFMFREPGGQIVAGPLSSILAVQLPRTTG
jgi:hypothetical protein